MTTSSGEQLIANLLLLEETFLWLPDTCKQDKNKLESEEKLMKCWKKSLCLLVLKENQNTTWARKWPSAREQGSSEFSVLELVLEVSLVGLQEHKGAEFMVGWLVSLLGLCWIPEQLNNQLERSGLHICTEEQSFTFNFVLIYLFIYFYSLFF